MPDGGKSLVQVGFLMWMHLILPLGMSTLVKIVHSLVKKQHKAIRTVTTKAISITPHLLDYLALCTDNLSDPEIALPGENFNTVLYTGNGSSTEQ